MTCSQWLSTVVFTALAVPVLAQKSGCDIVTPAEAALIVGSSVEKASSGEPCVYKVKGSTASLVVRNGKAAPDSIKARKANFIKSGGTVKDEPTLGANSYTAIKADSSRVYAFKGDQMLLIEFNDPSKGKVPAGLMDKLKAAAKKSLARL